MQEQLQHIEHPFGPVFDKHAKVLILGTMASPKSREVGFFYGHPQNRFWKVMGRLFDEPEPLTNRDRSALLLSHHIALWDVLASCDIVGASDASIRNPVASNLDIIFASASIEAIFTTGGKALALFHRYQKLPEGVALLGLPSTSPANARMSLDDLVAAYQPIRQYLSANTTHKQ